MEEMDFSTSLDNRELLTDWGAKLAEELDCKLLQDDAFRANRVENLVAGFSNICQLDCAFCGVHRSRMLNIPAEELDISRLIDLVNRHKQQTGYNLGHFRIGNTGEPLIHKEFINIIKQTQDAVNYYSIISNMSFRERRAVDFIAGHPKVEWINVSCDGGDRETYSKLRTGGDFDLVMGNAKVLIAAGKRVILNAVVFKENEDSLLKLPAILAREGFRELHVFYPLTHTKILEEHGLHKQSLSGFRDFFLKLRELCEAHCIPVSSDGWAFRTELIGAVPGIDTEEMFNSYAHSPCDALYHLILYPTGAFNNCSILNRLGLARGKEERPFYSQDLLEMLNVPEVLTLRKLQLLGYFPPPCKLICGKQDHPRGEQEAYTILKMKYPERNAALSMEDFLAHLKNTKEPFVIRALSPAVRSVLETYPAMHDYLDFIIDRDPKLSYRNHKVISPETVTEYAGGGKLTVLIASDRGAVLNSVIEQAVHFKEIYKLVISGSNPRDFTVQRLLP
ncbi:MAG: radical SAM protein [Syntrophobacteraceae bacterium]